MRCSFQWVMNLLYLLNRFLSYSVFLNPCTLSLRLCDKIRTRRNQTIITFSPPTPTDVGERTHAHTCTPKQTITNNSVSCMLACNLPRMLACCIRNQHLTCQVVRQSFCYGPSASSSKYCISISSSDRLLVSGKKKNIARKQQKLIAASIKKIPY